MEDEANEVAMAKEVHQTGPYEARTVYVKKSPIKNAGEGLFAKRVIHSGELCAIYAGILVPQSTVNRRKWALNDNTIEVNEDYSINVPKPFDSM